MRPPIRIFYVRGFGVRKKDLVTISRAIRLCCLVSLPNPIPLQEFFKFKLPSVRARSEQPEISKRCTFDCTFDRYDLSVSYSSVCPLSPSLSFSLSLSLSAVTIVPPSATSTHPLPGKPCYHRAMARYRSDCAGRKPLSR